MVLCYMSKLDENQQETEIYSKNNKTKAKQKKERERERNQDGWLCLNGLTHNLELTQCLWHHVV